MLAPQVEGTELNPEGAKLAALLVHGFCAAPDEMKTLGQFLEKMNVASFAVRLAGHGTTLEELKRTSWKDWYKSVIEGFENVRSWNIENILVIGFSMGGALSILLASEMSNIEGLILIAPALKIDGILSKLVPILKYFKSDIDVDTVKAQEQYDVKRTKCSKEPVSAYHEFFKLQKKARKSLHKIKIPTLIIQGTHDKTINPKSGQIAFEGISSEKKQLYMIEEAEHVIPCHWTRDRAYPHIQKFIEDLISSSQEP